MKEIEAALAPITGYMTTMTRNTVEGWYEIEIGIPKKWVYNDNNEIGIEVLLESDEGKLLKIFPKKNTVVVDDLILFTKIIITTNEVIAAKEAEFENQMAEFKKKMQSQAVDFYKELDDLKVNSFAKINDKFEEELNGGKTVKIKKKTDKVIEVPLETINSDIE